MTIENAIYGRRCRLIVGIGGTSAIDVTDLRWTFDIEKTMTEDPNRSEITIYNLNNYENSLREGLPIILEAGYEGNRYGAIFTGIIRQPLFGSDNNTDHFVKLIGLDSVNFINRSSINTTVAKGSSFNEIVDKCVGGGTEKIDKGTISNTLNNGTKLSRGKVMFGQPKKYLNQISNTNDMIFYTNNNEVNIIKPTDIPNNVAVELTPQTGLIGRPTQNEDGVSGVSLLHPSLDINTLVHINKSFIQGAETTNGSKLSGTGIYKIIKVKHTGDSYGNDWYTEFEAVAQPSSSVASSASR